ncbi:MAG: dehydratase [Rhodococcus sp.]|nr:dehydratase [Rhodococcus sp. (in: high G+C Gram-positive bacteria)]
MANDDVSGFFADDAVVGTVRTLGTHTVTEQEIVDFAGAWDPQFFHTDAAAAQGSVFGGLIASGIHTLAVYQRLEVQSRNMHWHVIAGAGVEGLRFLRPVRPGDALTGASTLTACQLEPDRRRGLLTFDGQLVNQDGKVVMDMTMAAYLHMRELIGRSL